jgi:hypothetical protein
LAVGSFLTITSLITAGHSLEDEVIHSEMIIFMQNYFSVGKNVGGFFHSKMVHLEYQKQKASVDNFDQHDQTDQLKIYHTFTINYTLLVFVSTTLGEDIID